jgi:uncharacterized membrane protein YeaQ/YmgE (transglycosylase-associated protein family)
MFSMIGHAIFGLIVGLVARMLIPGSQHMGIILTCLLGIGGGWLGGFLGKMLGWYREGEAAGFMMSVVGAIVLFAIVRFFV